MSNEVRKLHAPSRARVEIESGTQTLGPGCGASAEYAGDRGEKLIAVAVLLGILLRLMQYLGNRSLWLDEALLVPSILDLTFFEILDPFVVRPVPFGFLALQKAAVTLLGDYELVLRLLPLVAGIAAVVLFAAIARSVLTVRAVPIAVGMFAFQPFLIYYSSELKQYSTDVAFTLAVILLALHLRSRPGAPGLVLIWVCTTLVAVAVSLTSVFAIAAATVVLAVHGYQLGGRGRASRVILASVPAGLLFLLPYLAALVRPRAPVSDGPSYVGAFWSSGFMPLPPRSVADLLWFPHTILRVFQDPLGLLHNRHAEVGVGLALVGIAMFGVGCAWFFRAARGSFWLLLLPVLLTLVASGLQRYPFGADWNTAGRVILFLSPLFLLIMAQGVDAVWHWLSGRARLVAPVLALLLVLPSAVQATTSIPFGRGELKPLLIYVRENWHDGDVLYVHYDAQPAFRYYAPRYDFAESDFVNGVCARFQPELYLEALAELQGRPRVWVLFTAGLGAHLFNERALMLKYLDHVGQRRDDRVARGTSLYLYDLEKPPTHSEAFNVQIPVLHHRVEEGCALWES